LTGRGAFASTRAALRLIETGRQLLDDLRRMIGASLSSAHFYELSSSNPAGDFC
jgi:hypothetical protein